MWHHYQLRNAVQTDSRASNDLPKTKVGIYSTCWPSRPTSLMLLWFCHISTTVFDPRTFNALSPIPLNPRAPNFCNNCTYCMPQRASPLPIDQSRRKELIHQRWWHGGLKNKEIEGRENVLHAEQPFRAAQ